MKDPYFDYEAIEKDSEAYIYTFVIGIFGLIFIGIVVIYFICRIITHSHENDIEKYECYALSQNTVEQYNGERTSGTKNPDRD